MVARILGLLLLCCVGAPVFAAKVLVVPDRYSSIQEAIDAAETGDSVYVKPGTYSESLRMKSGVELVGAGRDKVLLRANALEAPAASGENLENVSIQHITFEHFGGTSADANRDNGKALIRFENSSVNFVLARVVGSPVDGIYTLGGSLAISDCQFERNAWGAICATDNARLYVYNSIIMRNADGVQIYNGTIGKVMQNTISENTDVGIRVQNASPSLLYNRCEQNTTGIWVGKGGTPLVEGNDCSRNTNCGILASEKITRPTIRSNICNSNGRYGIWVEEATFPAEFSNNKTSKNSIENVMRRGYWKY